MATFKTVIILLGIVIYALNIYKAWRTNNRHAFYGWLCSTILTLGILLRD